MPQDPIDPQTLHRNVMHVLHHGLRTATYKLATLSALIDYCVEHRPSDPSAELEVPIPELARRVTAIYWRQSEPLDGVQLSQSTQPGSRILDAITAVRSAAGSRGSGVPLDVAAQLAPDTYRRAIDIVTVTLAQQPLPRLQRLPGSARSVAVLYDDSFLHDNVTRSELQRRNNSIRLRPGVANGLATLEQPLVRSLRTMWVDDVLRMNHIPGEQRTRVEDHLFGQVMPPPAPVAPESAAESAAATSNHAGTEPGGNLATTTFASRLNRLFENDRRSVGQPYSSGEVAAKIRQTGFPMTVSAISQLRAGVGPAPSKQTVKALARFFGVTPAYLQSGADASALGQDATSSGERERLGDPAAGPLSERPSDVEQDIGDSGDDRRVDIHATPDRADGGWGTVLGPDLDQVAALCQIKEDGCWQAASSKSVRCRPRNDTRDVIDLPKIALHHWAWMVDNDLTSRPIPSYLIHIRRSCSVKSCCNPDHLYAVASGARDEELTAREVALLLENSDVDSAPLAEPPTETAETGIAPPGRIVLKDHLSSIAEYCFLDASGCLMAPTPGPVACRAKGDLRADRDLPMLAPHRWTWMVLNGYSSNPLPGNRFQVRRRCGKTMCCRPAHLYLATPDGEELSLSDVETWLRSRKAEGLSSSVRQTASIENRWRTVDRSSGPVDGGRHRAPSVDEGQGLRRPGEAADSRPVHDTRHFADRLNALFNDHTQPSGLPSTPADVAAALALDGLTVSEQLIERLRGGSAAPPNARTIEALAYFFNVGIEYFAEGSSAEENREQQITVADESESPEQAAVEAMTEALTEVHTARAQVIPMSIANLGRIVTGLSEAISECLARNPADVDRSGRLALLLVDVGALLTVPQERQVISRPLLRRIVHEWTAVGPVSHARQPILPLISALLDD